MASNIGNLVADHDNTVGVGQFPGFKTGLVTDTTVRFGESTYPIRLISSVSTGMDSFPGKGIVIFGVLLLFPISAIFITIFEALFTSPENIGLVYILFSISLIVFGWTRKPDYYIYLHMGGGETATFVTKDKDFRQQLLWEINTAIAKFR